MHNELNNDALALIRSARAGEVPPAASRSRVRYALAAKIGTAGIGTAGVGAGVTAHAAGATTFAASTKIVLVSLAIVAAGSGVGVWQVTRSKELPLRPATANVVAAQIPAEKLPLQQAPSLPATFEEFLELAPKVKVIKPVARRVSPAPVAMPKLQTNSLLKETSALAVAQEKLRAGNFGAAIVLLNKYQTQFPVGVLREESEATRIQAVLEAGNRQGACKLAHIFIVHWPRSPHLVRVHLACDTP